MQKTDPSTLTIANKLGSILIDQLVFLKAFGAGLEGEGGLQAAEQYQAKLLEFNKQFAQGLAGDSTAGDQIGKVLVEELAGVSRLVLPPEIGLSVKTFDQDTGGAQVVQVAGKKLKVERWETKVKYCKDFGCFSA